MKFTLLVNEGPFQRQSSDTALNFARAVIARGHEIYRVFFYHDGVNNGTSFASPSIDERQIQKEWAQLSSEYQIDLVICIAAAKRRGIIDDDEAKRQGLAENNLQDGFRISGLGQLIEGSIKSDRTVVFGD